jgi:ribose transport system permease protein
MTRVRDLLRADWVGPAVAALVMYFAFVALTQGAFMRGLVLELIARSAVVVVLCSVGMTLIIIEGGIDLSVGSVVALVSVVTALALKSGYGPMLAVVAGIVAGVLCGLLNGGLIATLEITPFIVTLGTMESLRGLAKGLAHEQKVDVEVEGLGLLMRLDPESKLPFPPGAFIAIAAAVVGAIVLRYTRYGRHVVAIGSSTATARLCGIPIRRVTILTYAIAGLLVGIAGVLSFSNLTVGDPTTSYGLELQVIAAVVVGGASMFGGQGSIAGSISGAMFMTVIATGCTHLDIPNWVQQILTGIIIVVAVYLDRLRHRA